MKILELKNTIMKIKRTTDGLNNRFDRASEIRKVKTGLKKYPE